MFYNSDNKVIQFCDGTNWQAMNLEGSGSGGCSTVTAGLKPEGYYFYNTDLRVMQVCAGNIWQAMGAVGGAVANESGDWTATLAVTPGDNSTPNTSDAFGFSIAVDDDLAVVGAYLDESDGQTGVNNAGRAYVYNITTGALITALDNPNPNDSDIFGRSVAIDGNTVVVGAPQDESDGDTGVANAGRAYVFNATTGALITALDNPIPTSGDNFGIGVGISGTLAIVGAYADESDGNTGVVNAGRAYVYDATTGSLVTALDNPSPNAVDLFGWSVSIDGNTAVVGAYQDESDGGTGVTQAGRAYVFNATTGALITALEVPTPGGNEFFGKSISISGNLVAVGASQDGAYGSGGFISGRAYVYYASSGVLVSTLNKPDPNPNELFGESISIDGNIVVVGAPSNQISGLGVMGGAYAFDATTGLLLQELDNPSPGPTGDAFGMSVAISGDSAVVGASSDRQDGSSGLTSGRAYFYTAPPGCLSPVRPEGTMMYNDPVGVMQYCDGGSWVQIGAVDPARDYTPDSFSFSDTGGQLLNTLVESDIVQITNIDNGHTVSVSGGDAQYRICTDGSSDANCDSSEVQTWTSAKNSIDAGQYIQLRLTSSASSLTTITARLAVGAGSGQWNVTTYDECTGGAAASVGDDCLDGTVYAGLYLDGVKRLFTTAADEGLFAWNNGNSTFQTNLNPNNADGQVNTDLLMATDSDSNTAGVQPHLAAQRCANSTANGHSDWYLPSSYDLSILYSNRTAIGGFNTSGGFPGGYYWTSTGYTPNSTTYALIMLFNSGATSNMTKHSAVSVRCVRIEP